MTPLFLLTLLFQSFDLDCGTREWKQSSDRERVVEMGRATHKS